MKVVDKNYNEITEYDESKGYLIESTIIKPDVIAPDRVTKFAYNNDDYENVLVFVEIPQERLNEQKIADLKQKLAETDYITLKLVEGAITQEEASDVLAMRAQWRFEINELGG